MKVQFIVWELMIINTNCVRVNAFCSPLKGDRGLFYNAVLIILYNGPQKQKMRNKFSTKFLSARVVQKIWRGRSPRTNAIISDAVTSELNEAIHWKWRMCPPATPVADDPISARCYNMECNRIRCKISAVDAFAIYCCDVPRFYEKRLQYDLCALLVRFCFLKRYYVKGRIKSDVVSASVPTIPVVDFW